MNNLKILIFCFLVFAPFQIIGQNYVVDFKVKMEDDRVKISISALDDFKYEVIPFDSKTYTLIKLYPVQFKQETKEHFIEPLKKSPVKIQTLELMGQTLLLTFKGILQKQVQVNFNKPVNKLEILVSPKLVTQQTIKRPGKTARDYYLSAVKLEKENRNLAAISAIRKALRLKPKYAEAYFLAGKIRFERGEWKMAKINFKRAKKMNPNVGNSQPYLIEIEKKLNPVQVVRKEVLKEEPKEAVVENEIVTDSTDVVTKEVLSDSSPGIDSSFIPLEPVSFFKQKKTGQDSMVNIVTEYPMQMKGQSYFQLVFLLLIVFVLVIWGILLWKKRSYFKNEKKYSSFDFSKMIQQMQNQTGNLGRDMPEMDSGAPIQKVEKIKMKNESKQESERPPVQRSQRVSFVGQKTQNIQTGFKWTEPKENSGKRPEEKVLHLASLGYSVEEIARQLQIGKGEVRLILNLRGKETPMYAPGVRIEMD